MIDNDILFFSGSFEQAISALEHFNLKLRGLYIAFPEVKAQYIELPLSNEIIDLTSVDGNIYYKQRSIQMDFDFLGDFHQWHTAMTKIASYLHGKRMKVVDTADAGFYYVGRLGIDTTKTDPITAQVTLTGTMNPFKYELLSSAEEWLWDPFDFVTGVIREYNHLSVNGSLSINIPGTALTVVPLMTVSAAMEVAFEGKTYNLHEGINKIYPIKLKEGDNLLTFKGYGTVSIDYRGGWL
ncbi:MAG: mtfA protein [Clostridiales bacterium]|nr:mtfA protein [Clostridiales bacterium]